MKNSKLPTVIMLCVCYCLQMGLTGAQELKHPGQDAPQTLAWVGRQAEQIDQILSDAMLMIDPFEIYLRLADSYVLFDAVAMAGVYCTEVRVAAESGRDLCDILHFRLEKDMNTKLQRAVDARLSANAMLVASKACAVQDKPGEAVPKGFTPDELLKHDVLMAALDIQDGLASNDAHILSQKLEHAIRLLNDAKTLASTLENCALAFEKGEAAILYCQKALGAPNWTEVHRFANSALKAIQQIQTAPECN
jgi:hypothetical protein